MLSEQLLLPSSAFKGAAAEIRCKGLTLSVRQRLISSATWQPIENPIKSTLFGEETVLPLCFLEPHENR
jgi:hypothetical protein